MTLPTLPPDGTPFVLLDDARPVGAAEARLYVAPVETITTRREVEVVAAFEALRTAAKGGLHAVGYLAYEAGCALDPALARQAVAEQPLLWFGLFREYAVIAADDVARLLPDPRSAWLDRPRPQIARAAYDGAIERVKELIDAGDIYQANLTFAASVRSAGHPLALYAGLRARAQGGYCAVIHDGRNWYLSCSPELFFSCDSRQIVTRPMKGTAARVADRSDDLTAKRMLCDDPKQRAENLMIVDLLRNDLSRVATPGSIAVPALFDVETFPTIHQMTSTVTGAMPRDVDAVDVMSALFPCGSITGAPKLRAMEVLDEIETGPRGIYTGAIGRIDAGCRKAAFNVAIRTIDLSRGRMGLGSGIVADSEATSEWEECLAKANFVPSDRQFDLIETMAFEPLAGLVRLERHLERMRSSAEALTFRFDKHAARNELQAATFRLRDAARVRLVLGARGTMAIEVRPMPAPPEAPVGVVIRPLATHGRDFRLSHKTTDRKFYDEGRRTAGQFEVLYHDGDGHLTEGSFTNIFVPRDGRLLTPPLARGLLAGILRQELLETGEAIECDLGATDLLQPFYVGNSLRGLLPARVLEL